MGTTEDIYTEQVSQGTAIDDLVTSTQNQETALEVWDGEMLLALKRQIGGITAAATAWSAASVVNTGAAAVAIKAAVASKKHWITQVDFTNITPGEYPVIELTEDHAGTPVILATFVCHQAVATSPGFVSRDFNPPIEVTSGKSIGFQLQSATGDVFANASGFVEA